MQTTDIYCDDLTGTYRFVLEDGTEFDLTATTAREASIEVSDILDSLDLIYFDIESGNVLTVA